MISTNAVTDLQVSVTQEGSLAALKFVPSLNPVPTSAKRGYYRLFFGTDANVSNSNYKAYTKVAGLLSADAASVLTSENFNEMGFEKGQTIYAKAYGDSYFPNDYEDPNSGLHIFPNLHATSSKAISFIVP
mgnify:CR=1 FL=1